MRSRLWFTVLPALLAAQALNAQVKGKVIEINAGGDTSVVPGVVLYWLNSSVSATSDKNGDFSIKKSGEQLVVKAIGYNTDTLRVTTTDNFLLVKLNSGSQLNEVEVVYYTSGTELSYLNPIKMEILNERALMKAACCNLSESFETNPSIDVNFADAVSGAKQIQMLGLGGQYAQITKENMPYLRGLANNYGLTFIPGTWIQSIQLSKGAGSVVNGYESFTGQINTELQNPENTDRLHANVYGNQNGRNEYNLNLSQKLGPKVRTGVLAHTSFNPLYEDHNHDGFADIPTGKQHNFINKYSIRHKNFEAQIGGGYLIDERIGGQAGDSSEHHAGFNMASYKTGINNRKWEAYSKTGYIFDKKPGTSMGLQLSFLNHNQDNYFGNNTYKGLQQTFYANYIFEGLMGTTDRKFRLGGSFMNDKVGETFNAFKFNREERTGGLFFEYAYTRSENFNLVAGLRADYHNYYGLFYTPRLHLRYAPTPRSVFRLSGGRALRTANILSDNTSLMVSSRQWSIEGNKAGMPYGLAPETGWNYGLNFTQKFRINYRDAYVTLDVYRTDFTSQVVTDVDADAQKVSIYNLKGPSYSNTAQFEFNMEPRKRLFVKTAYRFVDTRVNYKQGLLQKSLVSMHRAFINASYETKNKHWQFDFTTQYNGSKRLPITSASPAEYRRAAYSPDYFNLLGQITYLTKLKSNDFHVYIGGENLLNYKQHRPIVSANDPFGPHFDASMVWGPIYGRMLYAGLRFRIKARSETPDEIQVVN